MSFLISLFQNTEDEIVCSKNPIWLGTINSVNFRDDYDVFEPDIIIQTDEADIKDTLQANYNTSTRSFINDVASGKINYMAITENNTIRYYFVRSHEVLQANIIRIKLYEDVLKTRNTLIRSCSGIVRRNENSYNLLINDNRINTYADPVVRRKKFTGGSGAFTPSTPSNFVIAAGSIPTTPASYESAFILNVTRNSDSTAKNGGAIVFVPYSRENSTNLTNGSFDRFCASMLNGEFIPNWVICPSGALNGPYYQTMGQTFTDDGKCYICIVEKCNIDKIEGTQETGFVYFTTLFLNPVANVTWGSNITCYTAAMESGQPPTPIRCWHVGGETNWAMQGSGADLMVNSVWSYAGQANFPYVKEMPISLSSANFLRFNAYW